MNKNKIIEYIIVVLSILLINMYFNPNIIKYWKDTLLPLLLVAYPAYLFIYIIIKLTGIKIKEEINYGLRNRENIWSYQCKAGYDFAEIVSAGGTKKVECTEKQNHINYAQIAGTGITAKLNYVEIAEKK